MLQMISPSQLRTIVVEELTCRKACCILMRFGLIGNRQVFFVDISPAANILLPLFNLFLAKPIAPLHFKMIDIRDAKGNLIRLRLPYQDINHWYKEYAVIFEGLAEKVMKDDADFGCFMQKKVTSAILGDKEGAFRAMYLAHVVKHVFPKQEGELPVVLILNQSPWADLLDDYIKSLFVLPWWFTPLSPKSFLKDMFYIFRRYLNWLLCLSKVNVHAWQGKLTGSRLMVQYYGQLNLNDSLKHSDLFFLKASGISGNQVDLSFTLPQDPLDKDKQGELSSQGLKAIVLNPEAGQAGLGDLMLSMGLDWQGFLGGLKALCCVSKKNRWLYKQAAAFENECRYWDDIFSRRAIKIYVSWYKHDPFHCALRKAINAQGGVTVFYQRSFEEMPARYLALSSDVYFCFSPKAFAVEEASGSRIACQVAVGYYPLDRRQDLLPLALGIKGSLAKAGAHRFIAFLDENSADDERWHTGHGLMRDHYTQLFEFFLSNQDIGLILKPKSPATLLRRLGPVASLYEKAMATGRCYVFGEGKLQGNYPPLAAGLAADVVIHGHLDSGTAAIECALAGIPTLLMDKEGWPSSDLYRLGEGRVVFTQWPKLFNALRTYWQDPALIPGFGDWSGMLDDFDPYRDGKAIQRIGDFLSALHAALDKGLGRQEALDKALKSFSMKWPQARYCVNMKDMRDGL